MTARDAARGRLGPTREASGSVRASTSGRVDARSMISLELMDDGARDRCGPACVDPLTCTLTGAVRGKTQRTTPDREGTAVARCTVERLMRVLGA
jgi:hypothetical protein